MDIKDIIKPENVVYKKTPILKDNILHYCPGCSHGVVHKIVAEVIEEMGIQEKTIGISPGSKQLTDVLLLLQLLQRD